MLSHLTNKTQTKIAYLWTIPIYKLVYLGYSTYRRIRGNNLKHRKREWEDICLVPGKCSACWGRRGLAFRIPRNLCKIPKVGAEAPLFPYFLQMNLTTRRGYIWSLHLCLTEEQSGLAKDQGRRHHGAAIGTCSTDALGAGEILGSLHWLPNNTCKWEEGSQGWIVTVGRKWCQRNKVFLSTSASLMLTLISFSGWSDGGLGWGIL